MIGQKSTASVPILKKADEVLLKYIEKGTIGRFVETRWNSKFDRMQELSGKLEGLPAGEMCEDSTRELCILKNAISVMQSVISLLNNAQSDNYNRARLHSELLSVASKAFQLGYEGLSTVISDYLPWVENYPKILLGVLDGEIDLFSEETIGQAIEWARHLSPSIAEAFEKKYLEVIMKIESTSPISIKIFADQFLRKIPTSEAAVERVFSRHKLIQVRGTFHSLQCFTSLHHIAYIRRKKLLLQTCLILIEELNFE